MYIGKAQLTDEWQELSTLIQTQVSGQSAFAFDSDTTYQLQGEGGYGIRLCEAADVPADRNDGFVIEGTQPARFKPETGGRLYVKVKEGGSPAMPWLKISTLGE